MYGLPNTQKKKNIYPKTTCSFLCKLNPNNRKQCFAALYTRQLKGPRILQTLSGLWMPLLLDVSCEESESLKLKFFRRCNI
jgi:hypothetical protein